MFSCTSVRHGPDGMPFAPPVYQLDDPKDIPGAQHAVLKDKGHEAMVYLQVLIFERAAQQLVKPSAHLTLAAPGAVHL